MCNNVLILEENLNGQYVATPDFCDKKVIAHGVDPAAVKKEAAEKGYDDPVILFVPENIACVY